MPRFLLLKEIDDNEEEFDDVADDIEDDIAIQALYDVAKSLGINGEAKNNGDFEFFVSDNISVYVELSRNDYYVTITQNNVEEIDCTTNTSSAENIINDLTLATMVVSQIYDALRVI